MSVKINDLKVNILSFVLEDDGDVIEIIGDLLRASEFEAYKLFTNENELIKALTGDIHLCVVDHKLAYGMTGLEVLKEVKNRNRYSYVIVMSGLTDYRIIKQYLNAHADYYIDKNDPDYLDQLIEQMKLGLQETYDRAKFLSFFKTEYDRQIV